MMITLGPGQFYGLLGKNPWGIIPVIFHSQSEKGFPFLFLLRLSGNHFYLLFFDHLLLFGIVTLTHVTSVKNWGSGALFTKLTCVFT
jgi:hypothetical protein